MPLAPTQGGPKTWWGNNCFRQKILPPTLLSRSPTFIVSATITEQSRSAARSRSRQWSTPRFKGGNRSHHSGWASTSLSRKWAPLARGRPYGQMKASDAASPNHATTNRARKSNASRAASSHKYPSPARARASVTVASDATTFASANIETAASSRHHQPAQQQQQPPILQGTIDNKCPLIDNLQLAPWPPQYKAAPPPKYFRDSDSRKFLMCYEAAIVSSGSNETTLAKSFFISLKGPENCYARL
jgi:hypothetical protein